MAAAKRAPGFAFARRLHTVAPGRFLIRLGTVRALWRELKELLSVLLLGFRLRLLLPVRRLYARPACAFTDRQNDTQGEPGFPPRV